MQTLKQRNALLEITKRSKTRNQRKLSTATKIKAAYIGAIILWFVALAIVLIKLTVT